MHVCYVPADPNGYVDGFREIHQEMDAEPFPGDVISFTPCVPNSTTVAAIQADTAKQYRVVRRIYPTNVNRPCDVILVMRPVAPEAGT